MLNSIKLKNFKCFENEKIELSNLNLFCGTNSAGKSSLIQALLLFKQNQEQLIRNLFFIDKTIEQKDSLSLNGKLTNLGTLKNILYTEAKDDEIVTSISVNDQTVQLINKYDEKEWAISINPKKHRSELFSFFKGIKYISSKRISPETTYNLSDEDIKNENIGVNGEFTAHLLAENRHSELKSYALKHPKSVTNLLLENVSNWLSEISDNIEVNSRILPEVNQAILRFKYSYGKSQSDELPPQSVGFGLTHILPIITSLLIAKKGDVLIIENPESQLHPKAQAKLARLLCLVANQGTQLIIETHSDHILNGIRVQTKEKVIAPEKSKIYFLNRDLEKFKTVKTEIKINDDGSVDKWPKGFFDEWDNQLDKLLW